MADLITEFCGGLAEFLGGFSRRAWELIKFTFVSILKLVDHILSWVDHLLETMRDRFMAGWRLYQVELDVHEIPPNVIPPEKFQGAKKVSLSVLTDKYNNKKEINRAVLHNSKDKEYEQVLDGKDIIEITL